MSKLTTFGIEEKLKEHQAAIAQLEADLEIARNEDPELQLARELHEMLCTWNHTDGCGWYYEFNTRKEEDWSRHAHGEYLGRARKLTLACNRNAIAVEQALEIFKLVRGH